ncbi:Guanine nucleotide-binding protein alpha-4 subunit [Grifola frondosa]|uniref:Guanine nucleotide-binding protein alpha-4 subunit n=1 Tax=Grifola frondosa TaxID=5627 RepID=A0A1C7M6N2_GRIFR|nr:Guanine nucleotide-binding protein alpha-4 subunit [Grifola frondosa]
MFLRQRIFSTLVSRLWAWPSISLIWPSTVALSGGICTTLVAPEDRDILGYPTSTMPFRNAIIFMAPVSAFDQYLDEDPRTNRVDDSLQLFKHICSNALLKEAHLVLFLNKADVLREKLANGVQVKKYITSYGERPNEYEAVVAYFKAHFTQVHRRNNDNNRVLFTHVTSVVSSRSRVMQDTKTTQSIITDVRDSIFRGYLKSAALV